MQMIFAIAGGGAIGAILRHFLNLAVTVVAGSAFPWGIFLVNILGSVLMGGLVSAFVVAEPPQAVKAFLTVGVLGGFTTFSTFSLDAVLLIERGAWPSACFYVIGSVILSLAGLAGGMLLVRMIAA